MTENNAIRLLELLTNSYGKFHVLGHVSPDHADQFDRWSRAARRNDLDVIHSQIASRLRLPPLPFVL
jgi:hypothetical protein